MPADSKLSALTAIAQAAIVGADELYLVQASGPTSKRTTVADLIGDGTNKLLRSPAANVLAVQNGTTAQALRVYNTDDGAGNAEWLELAWSGNILTIQATKSGSGTVRTIQFPSSVVTQFSNGVVCDKIINYAGSVLDVGQNNGIILSGATPKLAITNAASGAGTPFTLQGSDAHDGNTNGGSIVVTPGAKSGSGTTGTLDVTTGQILAPLGSVSLPGMSFHGVPSVGFYYGGSGFIAVAAGAAGSCSQFFQLQGFNLRSDGQFGWSSTTDASVSPDTGIKRVAAKVVGVTDASSGAGQLVASKGLTTLVKAGTPVDGDVNSAVDGTIVVDSTANKIWVRVGGAWKGVAVA